MRSFLYFVVPFLSAVLPGIREGMTQTEVITVIGGGVLAGCTALKGYFDPTDTDKQGAEGGK